MNIQDIYDYAKLATLSYVDLSGYTKGLAVIPTNVVKEGASDKNPGATERIPKSLGTQMLNPGATLPDGTIVSADITGQWTVLDPYFIGYQNPNGHSDPASGFAAMLVQNDTTGKKVLTIAGTEPNAPGQFAQDLVEADGREIGFWGIALGQVVSLYNYVQVLRGTGKVDQLVLKTGETPPVSAQALLLSAANSTYNVPATYLWLEKTTQADGLGLIGANEQLTVTGHSLGGHLAGLAVALFPDLFTSAVTFNAPGYNPPSSLTGLQADNLLGLFTQFGADPATVASISGRVTTFESENASTGNDWSAVSGDITGTPFSSEQYITVETNTHDVGHMMDGLAIQALFAQLDPSLDLDKTGNIIKAASADTGKSYEELLKSLYLVLTGQPLTGVTDTAPDLSMVTAGDFAARSTYYDKLIALSNDAAFKALAGKVTVSLPAADIATSARTDFASLLALITLSPFTFKATTGNEAAVETALQTNWQTEHTNWQTDANLTDAQRDAGQANYSDQYLSDRAAMLSWMVKANQQDALTSGQTTYISTTQASVTDIWQFIDAGSNRTIEVSPTLPHASHKVYFGDSRNNTFFGTGQTDYLYGGAGMDRLDGDKGDDYLEGNAGSDILTGGEGRDTLLGGDGLDILEGGAGSDLLLGGTGTDTYLFTSGDRSDTIIDSDGLGNIKIGGTQIVHGKKVAEGSWISDDGQTTFTLVANGEGSNNLLINKLNSTDQITVRGWQANQLGLALDDTVTPPVTDNTMTGNASDNFWQGTDASDQMLGLGGIDILYGYAGSDVVDGGDNGDVLSGDAGRDTLIGGAGTDIIYGAGATSTAVDFISGDPQIHILLQTNDSAWTINYSGYIGVYNNKAWVGDYTYAYDPNDPLPSDDGNIIDGGTGDDAILAGPGADVAHGGADNDSLLGMAGNDTLFGDAGNDMLYGDSTADTSNFSYTPAALHGADILDGGVGNDYLVGQGNDDELYGGAGNDTLYGDDSNSNNTPDSVNGNDYLDGGADDDLLIGGGRNDTLFGGTGNDELWGDTGTYNATVISGNDYLDGGDGNDLLIGNGGADTLYGGEGSDELQGDADSIPGAYQGADYLDGGAGNDTLIGQGGADTLYGGDGNDELQGDADNVLSENHGADYLDGGAGNDLLWGQGGNDTLLGGTENDQLDGGAGDDLLYGGRGADQLLGGDGKDTLTGSGDAVLGADHLYTGGDTLAGGAGDDIYYTTAGDVIVDSEGKNTLVLAGNAADVVMGLTSTGVPALGIESGGQSIFVADGLNGGAITTYRFADGSTMSHGDLVGMALITPVNLTATNGVAYGGKGNDTLSALAGVDTTLSGGQGNDRLTGNTGNDTLLGGKGDDTMQGGAGNDTYLINADAGNDVIDNAASDGATAIDTIRIGSGVSVAQLSLFRSGDDLIIAFGTNSVRVLGQFVGVQQQIDRIVFDDDPGTTWDAAAILARVVPGPTDGNDVQHGTASNDHLLGLAGNDTLYGEGGDDTLDDALERLIKRRSASLLSGELIAMRLTKAMPQRMTIHAAHSGAIESRCVTVSNNCFWRKTA